MIIGSCPSQLSEDAIFKLALELPLLDASRMSPMLATHAAKLRSQFVDASSNAQILLRAMREAWLAWHHLPIVSSLAHPAISETVNHSNSNTRQPASANPSVDYIRSILLSDRRRDDEHMQTIFDRHKDAKGGLSKAAFIAALNEVEAPVISSMEDASDDALFRRADSDLSGSVGFNEFKRVANLPDDLEMLLSENGLKSFAPALRAHAPNGCNQLEAFRKVTTDQMHAATTASLNSMEEQLRKVQKMLNQVCDAQERLKDLLDQEPGKYQTRKMEIGSVEDFHKGLTDRIGAPNLDYNRSMRAEHCTLGGHDYVYTTGNYKITTTPNQEWLYIVGDEKGQRVPCPENAMGHGRRIVPIEDLLALPLAKRAKLTRAEMIAVVLYTGPMFVVYNGILRQYPKQLYEIFSQSDNRFSTTIFVLVSAVQKLSRCMNIPAGMLLYRGLGGLTELPDCFVIADENGCKGFTEFGFMSTTADRAVAVQYSGVKNNMPQASIFEIHPNAIDRGADISDFSQFVACFIY